MQQLYRQLGELMGGMLPPFVAPANNIHVLDIGWGMGESVYETALQYPSSHITGIDTDEFTVKQAQSLVSGLSNVTVFAHDFQQTYLDFLPFLRSIYDVDMERTYPRKVVASRCYVPMIVMRQFLILHTCLHVRYDVLSKNDAMRFHHIRSIPFRHPTCYQGIAASGMLRQALLFTVGN